MRLLRVFLLIVVVALLMSTGVVAQEKTPIPSNLGFKLPKGKKRVKIPFELYNNLIVVPVVLNETLPLNFIVDTGVRTAILTEKVLTDILNISYTRKINVYGAGGEKVVEALIAPNVSIELPGITSEGHSLLVLEEDYLQLKNFLGTDVHGILGYELFSRFIVHIDYSLKIITLTYPEYYKPKKKYTRIPITIEDTKPYIEGSIVLSGDSIPVRLMVDTGASHSLMIESTSSERISVPEKKLYRNLGRGLGGSIYGNIARVHHLSLDGYEFEEVIGTFPDPASYSDSLRHMRNGTIGGGITHRFNITFDFGNGFIYLKKNRFYKKSFEYNLTGIVVKASGRDFTDFEVSEVTENSVGEKAGIQRGDKILRINNLNASDLKLETIYSVFNSRPNRKISITIKREDKIIVKRFRLERQI